MERTIGLYVLYDKVAEESGPIFQAVNDAVAARNVRIMFDHEKVTNPEEYKLFCIGSFCNSDMLLVAEEPRAVNATLWAQKELPVEEAGNVQ